MRLYKYVAGADADEACRDLERRIAEVNPAAIAVRTTIDDGRIAADRPLPPERSARG